MMNNGMKEKYVTQAVFKQEIQGLHQRLDNVEKTMATKDAFERLALAVEKNTNNIRIMNERMATKDDVDIILNRIDAFAKKTDVFVKRMLFHGFRFDEIQPTLKDHEKRITALEVAR